MDRVRRQVIVRVAEARRLELDHTFDAPCRRHDGRKNSSAGSISRRASAPDGDRCQCFTLDVANGNGESPAASRSDDTAIALCLTSASVAEWGAIAQACSLRPAEVALGLAFRQETPAQRAPTRRRAVLSCCRPVRDQPHHDAQHVAIVRAVQPSGRVRVVVSGRRRDIAQKCNDAPRIAKTGQQGLVIRLVLLASNSATRSGAGRYIRSAERRGCRDAPS